jgi:hypothetical protein
MPVLQPPPTYELPIQVDEKTGKAAFSPIWLNWFLQFSAIFSASGGGTPAPIGGDAVNIALAVKEFSVPRSVPGVSPLTMPLAPDDASLVLATREFSPVRQSSGLFQADSQMILANQIFGG